MNAPATTIARVPSSVPVKPDYKAPEGFRIEIVRGVKANHRSPWNQAIQRPGFDTPVHFVDQPQVSDAYPIGSGEEEMDLLLLGFSGRGQSWHIAAKWADSVGLVNTQPREVFAIAEIKPRVSDLVRQKKMMIAASTLCVLDRMARVCYLRLDDISDGVDLAQFQGFGNQSYHWIAYRIPK